MRAELISVGTELLLGQIVDTNAAYLASELPALGIDCFYISQVGDNLDRLVETLQRALSRSDVVTVTGGLGPTEDDLTREAIAALLGESMVVQPELEAQLTARFARLGRQMPASNLKQATLIASAQAIPNPVGSAPGWWVERPRAGPERGVAGDGAATDGAAGAPLIVVAMPGVPSEMRRMWEHEVRPRLRRLVSGVVIVSRTLKVLGVGESQAEEKIRAFLRSANPTIGTYAKSDGVHLRLTAKAADEAAARAVITPVEAGIRAALGDAVYGVDDETPQDVVCDLLGGSGQSVATLDYGTGGALSGLFAEAPGRQSCFAGGLVAESRPALVALGVDAAVLAAQGPVSPAGAAALARTTRVRLGATLGLALAGALDAHSGEPQPVGTIFVALDDGKTEPRIASISYATAISEMRRLGALTALNLLRQSLLGQQAGPPAK
ncbi:MAG: molybdopterin-binding protein [Candidatus Bathyarchaeota archaeon]|nr:molybdopterin-binding protein [Candidatus Bathyarchaeota archaeon]